MAKSLLALIVCATWTSVLCQPEVPLQPSCSSNAACDTTEYCNRIGVCAPLYQCRENGTAAALGEFHNDVAYEGTCPGFQFTSSLGGFQDTARRFDLENTTIDFHGYLLYTREIIGVVTRIPPFTIQALPLTAAGKEEIQRPLMFNWGRGRGPGTGLCGHSIEFNFTSAYERYYGVRLIGEKVGASSGTSVTVEVNVGEADHQKGKFKHDDLKIGVVSAITADREEDEFALSAVKSIRLFHAYDDEAAVPATATEREADKFCLHSIEMFTCRGLCRGGPVKGLNDQDTLADEEIEDLSDSAAARRGAALASYLAIGLALAVLNGAVTFTS